MGEFNKGGVAMLGTRWKEKVEQVMEVGRKQKVEINDKRRERRGGGSGGVCMKQMI